MRRTTDTNPKYGESAIPDGQREFEVVKVTEGPKGSDRWVLRYGVEGSGEQLLWPNDEGALLRVLKFTEVSPGVFDWDTDLAEGKKFIATVSHEPDKKKPDVIRQKMRGFKPVEDLPF